MEKRLMKSKQNKVISGVCGGLGEYFDIDPTILRIVWVIMALNGVGLLAYIIAAIVMPEPVGNAQVTQQTSGEANQTPKNLLGIILIGMGSYWLIREYIPWIDFDYMWPVVLILVGGYLLFKEKE